MTFPQVKQRMGMIMMKENGNDGLKIRHKSSATTTAFATAVS